MANYCYYEMKVQGRPESVDEFIKIIKADYDYDNNKFSFERHFWRVFEAEVSNEEIYEGVKSCIISGNCAWSVEACMFDRGTSYQASFRKNPKIFGCSEKTICRGTDIIAESKCLNLIIEIYSEEEGIGFQEHYLIINGDLIIDECVNYSCFYWDEYEYPTIEDFNEGHNTNFTEDMFDNNGELKIGGFKWEYDNTPIIKYIIKKE